MAARDGGRAACRAAGTRGARRRRRAAAPRVARTPPPTPARPRDQDDRERGDVTGQHDPQCPRAHSGRSGAPGGLMRPTPSFRLLACALAVLALSACGGSGGGAADPDLSTQSGVLAAEAEARGPSTADAVDACALIDEAKVLALIDDFERPATSGVPGGDGGGCSWENKTDYHSVTVDVDVDVGAGGTAAGGALPTADPAMG